MYDFCFISYIYGIKIAFPDDVYSSYENVFLGIFPAKNYMSAGACGKI